MPELRWVLLGLGVLVVAAVYVWGRGGSRRSRASKPGVRRRAEPHISIDPSADGAVDVPDTRERIESDGAADADGIPDQVEPVEEPSVQTDPATGQSAAARRRDAPEKVVTIRFIPKAGELAGDEAVLALRAAGLEHGRYGIFHMNDADSGEALFSVASLTEPGSFDLKNLTTSPIAGMSFFMVLPGNADPVVQFDAMVRSARDLAVKLEAELFDDRGSSWSIQRERYVREEIIEYRHQLVQTEVVGNAQT